VKNIEDHPLGIGIAVAGKISACALQNHFVLEKSGEFY
jgi:hypothetical protein